MTTPPIKRWFRLSSGPGSAADNMALDEALLEAAPRLGQPVLRFYGWNEPAASFGYFQKIRDLEQAMALRPLVRRPTGGGLVLHDADWTYSLVFPTTHSWYSLRAAESYERVHRWMQDAFAQLRVTTELAPVSRREMPGQCFAGFEKSDLLLGNRKIAGAAQRRTKTGLLLQGSVQPPPGILREAWEQALCQSASAAWRVVWIPWAPDAVLLARAARLAAEKYSQASYNRRR